MEKRNDADPNVTRDYLRGSTGSDLIQGKAGEDNLFGLAGNDIMSGVSGANIDNLCGGAGANSLTGVPCRAKVAGKAHQYSIYTNSIRRPTKWAANDAFWSCAT